MLVGRCGVEIALATIVAHVLVCVCRVDHVDGARFLLRHGASVNAPETSGDTALKATFPHRDVVYLLLADRALFDGLARLVIEWMSETLNLINKRAVRSRRSMLELRVLQTIMMLDEACQPALHGDVLEVDVGGESEREQATPKIECCGARLRGRMMDALIEKRC